MKAIFAQFISQVKRIIEEISSLILPYLSPPETTPPPPELQDYIHTASDPTSSILGFCFASALGFLVLHFQNDAHENAIVIPQSVHFFGLFMVCCFSTIFVSQFLATDSYLARILKRIGYVFTALAFLLALAIPSPLWLRILYGFVFAVGFFVAFKYGSI